MNTPTAGLHRIENAPKIWQQVICEKISSGAYREALNLYQRLQDSFSPSQILFLSLLKACANLALVKEGRYLHDRALRYGFPSHGVIGNTLIDMYAKCGSLWEAQKLFDSMSKRSRVSWSAIISGHVQHGHGIKAIKLFDSMLQQGVSPSKTTFLSSLKACGSTYDLGKGRRIHDQIVRSQLDLDLVMGSTILDMYAKCGRLNEAGKVFDDLQNADVIAWNALLSGYSQNDEGHLCLQRYEAMLNKGIRPTKTTFLCTLKACTDISAVEEGRFIHNQIIRDTFLVDEAIASSLICMYASCKQVLDARSVCEKHSKQSAKLWSVLLSTYVQQGSELVALELFEKMQCHFKAVDKTLFPSVLKACGKLRLVVQAGIVYDQIIKDVERIDVILGSALVDMYCNCGVLEAARVVFDRLSEKNEITWGAMIAGYAEQGHGGVALDLFGDMQNEGLPPNRAICLSALKACSKLGNILEGRLMHDLVLAIGLDADAAIISTLVDMYAKCKAMNEALLCLTKVKDRDLTPWNAMMSGYIQHGCDHSALKLMQEMLKQKIEADEITVLCALQACSRLGAIDQGNYIHSLVVESVFSSNIMIGGSLVNMYAKCGRLADAQRVFSNLPRQDLVSWSAVIAGYAEVGDCETVRSYFERMLEQGYKPDSDTFSSLLAACSHAGDVGEGFRYFKAMNQAHGITPTFEHFNCLIGLLSHAGCLAEANKVMSSMPISPDMTGWLSLLLACKNHGTYQLGSNCFNEAIRIGQV